MRNRHIFYVDILLLGITPIAGLTLRLDSNPFDHYTFPLVLYIIISVIIRVIFFHQNRSYRQFWRYASIDQFAPLFFAIVLSSLLLSVFFLFLGIIVPPRLPRSMFIIEPLLALIGTTAVRLSIVVAHRHSRLDPPPSQVKRSLIIGAGEAGVSVARELNKHTQLGVKVVGFLDDDPSKQGTDISGVRVLGKLSDLPHFVSKYFIDRIFIAMPSAPSQVVRDVVTLTKKLGIETQILPGLSELIGGRVTVQQFRKVQIDDLLRRPPVKTNIAEVKALLEGKVVMVTGGGGSIGGELCRQIITCRPKHLIILGHGENSIFSIEQELKLGAWQHETKITPLIADIRFAERVETILTHYRPNIIFHAAAHKHVPLMEQNPAEAITNNIIGTRNLLHGAQQADVTHFVMISSDKAVNPTSVMGATKRAAELLVHRTAQQTGRPYVAVRFGNVLGSRGSVIHTFNQQIAAGGPITVTHPEIERFFMTIPEAVQLVLQASVLGHGGEVFVLDMGKPIKIVDLASDLIRLSGLEPGRDIEIAFTGLRPGEKLYEELFIEGEAYQRTTHSHIFTANNAAQLVPTHLDALIAQLEEAAQSDERERIMLALKSLVPEFSPPNFTFPKHIPHPA